MSRLVVEGWEEEGRKTKRWEMALYYMSAVASQQVVRAEATSSGGQKKKNNHLNCIGYKKGEIVLLTR